MATFDVRTQTNKENLGVDSIKRTTDQKVQFTNKENVYYGTFAGKLSCDDMYSENATFVNPTLSGLTLYNDKGKKISIDSIFGKISDLSVDVGELNDLYENSFKYMGILDLENIVDNSNLKTLFLSNYDVFNIKDHLTLGHVYHTKGQKKTVSGKTIFPGDMLVFKDDIHDENITWDDVIIIRDGDNTYVKSQLYTKEESDARYQLSGDYLSASTTLSSMTNDAGFVTENYLQNTYIRGTDINGKMFAPVILSGYYEDNTPFCFVTLSAAYNGD